MNALDPTVAEFRERLKHQRTEKKRRLNAMNCKPENSRFLARFGMPVRFCRASREHPRATIEGKIVGKNFLPSIIPPEPDASPHDGPV